MKKNKGLIKEKRDIFHREKKKENLEKEIVVS